MPRRHMGGTDTFYAFLTPKLDVGNLTATRSRYFTPRIKAPVTT